MLRTSDSDTIDVVKTHHEGTRADDDERSIGELVHELIEEGKAYAKAEVELVKAIASAKAKALMVPAIVAVAAIFIVQAALNVLGVGLLLGLAFLIGPVLAGILVFLIMAAIAGGMVWWAAGKAREALK